MIHLFVAKVGGQVEAACHVSPHHDVGLLALHLLLDHVWYRECHLASCPQQGVFSIGWCFAIEDVLSKQNDWGVNLVGSKMVLLVVYYDGVGGIGGFGGQRHRSIDWNEVGVVL